MTGLLFDEFEEDYQAFLWDGIDVLPLGTLGGDRSAGNAVNNQGWVTGMSYMADGLHPRGFLWNGDELIDLGHLGGDTASGKAVNDSGIVAGWSTTVDGKTHAFIWKNNVMVDLGTLGAEDDYSAAWEISPEGEVLGHCTGLDGKLHIVKWSFQEVAVQKKSHGQLKANFR